MHLESLTSDRRAAIHLLGGWDATSYVQQSHDEAPDAVSGSHDDLARQAGLSGQPRVMGRPGLANTNQCRGLYMLPLEYTMSSDEPEVKTPFSSLKLGPSPHFSSPLCTQAILCNRILCKIDKVEETKDTKCTILHTLGQNMFTVRSCLILAE